MSKIFNLAANMKRGALVLSLACLLSASVFAIDNSPKVENKAATNSNAVGQTTATSPIPEPTPVRSASSQNQTADTAQGKQYGQPGFVGERINLNVVNADIRDILNYITEQYGVNFVIDSSVGKVSVTVNVSNVPWNQALDSVLNANRLGIEVNGDILRVAEKKILADEYAEKVKIRDNVLDSSPLYTEFIRLNYARASGTLGTQAGNSSGFSGGQVGGPTTTTSDATGGGADSGILPIISRRLSRRGSVEVDGRSNTLIITDVRENIDAIRQLVGLLDQPEPQVEIETRIVIASRNFSRDLGFQLKAVVFGDRQSDGTFNRGISVGTLPGSTGGQLQPGGIPGGIAGTPQPGTGLGATNATTVIGLTTGIFGTAQITAALTAAETKGQIKIIASPRLTVLNNRSAQVESGQQIPVTTAQAGGAAGGAGGGGGAGVGQGQGQLFTTTFVSVPLRLSVTPQITDAGTVLLRVTAENNTVNQTLASGLTGTPGIDTQRMQTEVLVPDGGTTVVGGVLQDTESNSQNRTPGLSGIPILGNLFKRKTVTRQTQEILFFITPRIYRPDYQGNPINGVVSPTGNRTQTILQPVPLGNPPTNTPTPVQLQQQQNTPQPGVNPQTPSTSSPVPTNPPTRP
jgi:type IV pilus assembly protein PilQ